MTEPKGTGRGRKKGSKNKATLEREAAIAAAEAAKVHRKRSRLREKLEDGLTDEEIMGLSAELKARLLAGLQPKEPVQPSGNTFKLVVQGLSSAPIPADCPQCKHRFMVSAPVTEQRSPGTFAPPVAREDAPGSTETSSTERKDAHLPLPKGLPGDFFQEDPAKPEPPVRFSINKDSLDLG